MGAAVVAGSMQEGDTVMRFAAMLFGASLCMWGCRRYNGT